MKVVDSLVAPSLLLSHFQPHYRSVQPGHNLDNPPAGDEAVGELARVGFWLLVWVVLLLGRFFLSPVHVCLCSPFQFLRLLLPTHPPPHHHSSHLSHLAHLPPLTSDPNWTCEASRGPRCLSQLCHHRSRSPRLCFIACQRAFRSLHPPPVTHLIVASGHTHSFYTLITQAPVPTCLDS